MISVCIFSAGASAQQKYSILQTDSVTNSLFQKGYWKQLEHFGSNASKQKLDFFDLDYRTGVAFYNRKMYAFSEKYFRKAYAIYQTKDIAQYIYYGLIFRGLFSEAEKFNLENHKICEISSHYRKGTESLNLDAGLRFSNDMGIAGNILYSNLGRLSKPKPNVTLMQSIFYLQQKNPSGDYTQFEYFISREAFTKNGWYYKPSIHYALTLFNTSSTAISHYTDSIYSSLPPTGLITVKNTGTVNDKYTIRGTNHSFNLAYQINKRKGPLTFGFEPAAQVVYTAFRVKSNYTDSGIYDSSVNGIHVFSIPYSDTGSKTKDSTTISYIGQIGMSIAYTWPLKGTPIFSRLSGYYLFDNKGRDAIAWNFYSLLTVNDKFWIHFSYSYKGALPWAFNSEEIYYNTYNTVKSRTSLTIQFMPLKRFSPMLTYQYEQDLRATDNIKVKYNSIYLTLKYRL